jgi:hypothetical protein
MSEGVEISSKEVEEDFNAVLDHLLTPPHIKAQLIESQSLERKLKTIQMYQQSFENWKIKISQKSSGWGERENALLSSIGKSKTPDMQSISKLKVTLTSANKQYLESFLDSGGVAVLLKAIDNRICKDPPTELDIAILYELFSCCKAIMNNSIGMDGFISVDGAIDTLSRCLRFEFKQFTLLVTISSCLYSFFVCIIIFGVFAY